MNYCQDGLQVYFATETQQYNYVQIYGHYELQPYDVNYRPYFKMGFFGFWWDGIDLWWIGQDNDKGQPRGFAYYDKDLFCPYQLSESNWALLHGTSWQTASFLGITCKYIFIETKQ